MKTKCYWLISCVVICSVLGCAKESYLRGRLGFEDMRRIVVLGDYAREGEGVYYQQKYHSLVWQRPSKGAVTNSLHKARHKIFGPSESALQFAKEIRSVNYTIGLWEFIVVDHAQSYFISALKLVEDGAIAKAEGRVIVLSEQENKRIVQEIERISHGSFHVEFVREE